MRHMVASFLLGRSQYQPQPNQQSAQTKSVQISSLNRDALPQIALPIILSEKAVYSDSFTQFTEALFEDFEFDRAIKLANALADEAENDILLKPHAKELRRSALLYVFEVQSRLFKQGNDLDEFCKENNIEFVEQAVTQVQTNLTQMGLIVQTEGPKSTQITIEGNHHDTKGKIHSKTIELVRRTEELNKNITQQVNTLQQVRKDGEADAKGLKVT